MEVPIAPIECNPQIKTKFRINTYYLLDKFKDRVEFGFPIFTSRVDHDTGLDTYIFLLVKNGPKADQIQKFFKKKVESLQQPDETFLKIRDVALDYYFNVGKQGYKDITMGKTPDLDIDKIVQDIKKNMASGRLKNVDNFFGA